MKIESPRLCWGWKLLVPESGACVVAPGGLNKRRLDLVELQSSIFLYGKIGLNFSLFTIGRRLHKAGGM